MKDQAIVLAKAGTDIIAPSDMMDGRIKIIRDALEQNDFINTLILAYSAKLVQILWTVQRRGRISKILW